jgi:hypothetical protein
MGGDEPLAAVRISARPHRGDALGIDGPVYFSPDPEEPADAAGRTNQLTHAEHLGGPRREIYDIFEGTEQIQQLVIARAISGLRIE